MQKNSFFIIDKNVKIPQVPSYDLNGLNDLRQGHPRGKEGAGDFGRLRGRDRRQLQGPLGGRTDDAIVCQKKEEPLIRFSFLQSWAFGFCGSLVHVKKNALRLKYVLEISYFWASHIKIANTQQIHVIKHANKTIFHYP